MLLGILSFFIQQVMLSFVEYASEKRILELLIKERAKVAVRGTLKKISPDNREKKVNRTDKLSIAEHISLLMPPRDSWVRPRFRRKKNAEVKAENIRKSTIIRSITLTIAKHRKSGTKYAYLERLDGYIASLKNDIASSTPLKFRSLKIVPKTKKVVRIDDKSITINRPICNFTSMREKLLISLACKYLSDIFDPYLHEEILSYRPLRKYHGSDKLMQTNRDNAIENLQEYRRKHRNSAIYVAECDIQKYYDTINHDVVRKCLSNMAEKVKQDHLDFDYKGAERIIDAYLNSFSFEANIESLNRKYEKKGEACRFETPKRELLLKYCYSEQERLDAVEKCGAKAEITRFKGLGEISPDEFAGFIGEHIRLDKVRLTKDDPVTDLLTFYMGTNTFDRQHFIMDNLRIEEDLIEQHLQISGDEE